jgi:glutamine synthetase
LKTSALLKDYFGERFLEIFHAIKAAECRRFSAQVSELDFEWYLTRA